MTEGLGTHLLKALKQCPGLSLPCHCFVTGVVEYSCMRLTCKTWKRELDLCTHHAQPAFCDMPRVVKLFQNVRSLDLSVCNLTVRDEDLSLLCGLPKLAALDLRGCAAVSPPLIPIPSPTCLFSPPPKLPSPLLRLPYTFVNGTNPHNWPPSETASRMHVHMPSQAPSSLTCIALQDKPSENKRLQL